MQVRACTSVTKALRDLTEGLFASEGNALGTRWEPASGGRLPRFIAGNLGLGRRLLPFPCSRYRRHWSIGLGLLELRWHRCVGVGGQGVAAVTEEDWDLLHVDAGRQGECGRAVPVYGRAVRHRGSVVRHQGEVTGLAGLGDLEAVPAPVDVAEIRGVDDDVLGDVAVGGQDDVSVALAERDAAVSSASRASGGRPSACEARLRTWVSRSAVANLSSEVMRSAAASSKKYSGGTSKNSAGTSSCSRDALRSLPVASSHRHVAEIVPPVVSPTCVASFA